MTLTVNEAQTGDVTIVLKNGKTLKTDVFLPFDDYVLEVNGLRMHFGPAIQIGNDVYSMNQVSRVIGSVKRVEEVQIWPTQQMKRTIMKKEEE